MRFLQIKTMIFWQECLAKVATSGSKMNEKNAAADDPNGLASVIIQEIHTDNEAVNLRHV